MTFTYHRLANPITQNITVAKMQVRTGEVWGYEHRGGLFPSVKAYRGSLSQKEGIQFDTSTLPDKYTPNNLAIWRLPQHGGATEVEERQQGVAAMAACVKVKVVMCRYRCGRPGT
jgi:hypothetical protein